MVVTCDMFKMLKVSLIKFTMHDYLVRIFYYHLAP